MFPRRLVFPAVSLVVLWAQDASAGVIFDNDGLAGGARWDASPRTIGGNERSLAGGLRYSLQGGSYAAYRDLFQWAELPAIAEFQQAVEQAFAAWEATDPANGLHAALRFVADLETPVVGSGEFLGFNVNGAEIDLLAADSTETRIHAVTNLDPANQTVTLTSGTTNYPGSSAISGVDITLNNNAGARYSLPLFRRLLAHEIGHAIGLNDVEAAIDEPQFIDDNLDASTSASLVATLNNSWALSINPANPAASPLHLYPLANGDPGNDTPGVDLLMESVGLGIAPGNPVTSLVPLTNDEYATRQFLYPSLERDVVVTGDYSRNGIVDAADYVVWRDTLGEDIFWPGDGADGDQSGFIDEGDYEFWRAHFGNLVTSQQLNPTATTVPEPLNFVLAAGGMLAAANRRWRSR